MLRRCRVRTLPSSARYLVRPAQGITVEQSVGNPEYFDEDVYDTEVKDRFRINNLDRQREQRGEENIADKAWVKRSLVVGVCHVVGRSQHPRRYATACSTFPSSASSRASRCRACSAAAVSRSPRSRYPYRPRRRLTRRDVAAAELYYRTVRSDADRAHQRAAVHSSTAWCGELVAQRPRGAANVPLLQDVRGLCGRQRPVRARAV